jgi:hypothetical protein
MDFNEFAKIFKVVEEVWVKVVCVAIDMDFYVFL